MGAIIALLAPMFMDILKRMIPDPEKQAEAKQQMQELINQASIEANKAEAALNENKKDIIVTEMANGFAGNWRAYLMLACIAMLINSWILTPLLNAFLAPLGVPIIPVPIPPEAWTLITVGLGGYIGKETMQTYSDAKVQKAMIENPPNDKAFYDAIRDDPMFKGKGIDQNTFNMLQTALKARDNKNG